MKPAKLSCPFTGITFEATQDELDYSLTCIHPISGEIFTLKYHQGYECYMIPEKLFSPITDIITLVEAAAILNVSRQRIYKIANDCVIPTIEINDKKYMKRSDVLKYKQTRKSGKPRKDK